MQYSFTLRYQLANDDAHHGSLVERLAAAGCDDALVGIGRAGTIRLAFVREAATAEAAVLSAQADVQRAIPGASLIEP